MDVRLVEHMGNDSSIVQAARVSYGDGTKSVNEDRQLIRYLMRHWHTTPFEMVEFKFHVRVPIFVARQWLRHRTASVNELSARYSVVKDDFWIPSEYRTQSSLNKQGSSSEVVADVDDAIQKKLCESAFEVYTDLLSKGVSRELARVHLPQSTFTEFYWKINLHNLFHFLNLRMDSHAQQEIQECSRIIFKLIQPIVPVACEAFLDYRVNSVTLTGPECIAIQKKCTDHLSKGEKREFENKCQLLGLQCMTGTEENT